MRYEHERPRTPLPALFRGLVAGTVGAYAQSLFFRATRRIAPRPTGEEFEPPEPKQRGEPPTETVARRFVEDFMKRGPLTEEQKKKAGTLVHYLFGAGWGGLYGLVRASAPGRAIPAAGAGYGLLVWAVAYTVLLPAFRLGPRPRAYPPRHHAYAIAAHIVYGLATQLAYRSARRSPLAAAMALLARARPLPRALQRAAAAATKVATDRRAPTASWVEAFTRAGRDRAEETVRHIDITIRPRTRREFERIAWRLAR